MIWAECLMLLNNNDVYLVTNDKAFYQERKYENGLNEILLLET